MRTRLSRRKPSFTTRGARADPPKTMMGSAWRDMGASDAEGFRAPLAEEASGTEDKHGDEEHEVDDFLPRGAEDVAADDLTPRHDDRPTPPAVIVPRGSAPSEARAPPTPTTTGGRSTSGTPAGGTREGGGEATPPATPTQAIPMANARR